MEKPHATISTQFHCPRPAHESEKISMSHGGGGKLMHQLIQKYIQPLYKDPTAILHDSTVVNSPGSRIAMTTDSFVVNPVQFPGGDIGQLAVCGTINDLAMAGAKPRYMSLAFIIEEGLSLELFESILLSIRHAAEQSQVEIVTGDTKVVERGKGDQIFINTSGIGEVAGDLDIRPGRIAAGDAIIINGDIGRHGVAIMSSRDGTSAEVGIDSDLAPLDGPVQSLIDRQIDVHCLRDLTRGGLASALNELAEAADLGIVIDEASIPVNHRVASYCEILGLEPHYLANEGRFICILPQSAVDAALQALGPDATRIGTFDSEEKGFVRLRSQWDTQRFLPMLSGEQLPRIC